MHTDTDVNLFLRQATAALRTRREGSIVVSAVHHSWLIYRTGADVFRPYWKSKRRKAYYEPVKCMVAYTSSVKAGP